MAILVGEKTRALVQGITGREGSKAAAQMLDYGTSVVAGVTPGKARQLINDRVPVFDTVAEALESFPEINASSIYVPPPAAKDAAFEALESGIPLVHIFTEKIPVRDTAEILALAREKNARVIGPSSVGIISPGKGKIGSIGGASPDRVFAEGNVALISKSGGMTSEISWILKKSGLGQSTAVGIGGDIIACSNFADLMVLLEKDRQTKALVMFGELGGVFEEQAAELIKSGAFSKPVAAFISGRFSQQLPSSLALGHAGAILQGSRGSVEGKVKALEEAGARVAKIPDELPELVKEQL